MGMAGVCFIMKRLLSAHMRRAVERVTEAIAEFWGKDSAKAYQGAPSLASLNHQFFFNSAKWEAC